MRKRTTTRLASLRRPCALLFRLSLLTAIWHAPLPTIHWHEEADDHAAATIADNSKLEIEFVLPCQLNGCEDSSHGDESEHDHSTHIASIGYGFLGDADVDLIDNSFLDHQPAPVLSMAIHQPSTSSVSQFAPAQQATAAATPSLPLRANLQVFRI